MTHRSILLATALIVAEIALSMPALARGGGSGFMQSPGYQRRLQESRGQVTNRSSSFQPYTQPPAVYPRRPLKRQQMR